MPISFVSIILLFLKRTFLNLIFTAELTCGTLKKNLQTTKKSGGGDFLLEVFYCNMRYGFPFT